MRRERMKQDGIISFRSLAQPWPFATDARSGAGENGAVKNKREPCTPQTKECMLSIIEPNGNGPLSRYIKLSGRMDSSFQK